MACTVLLVLVTAGLSACAERVACTAQVLTVSPAPADEVRAVTYSRACSPTDISMNLSILPQGEEVRDVMGNVLVLGMDPTRGTADFPRVSWRGRNRLEVRYDTALAVRPAVAEVAAVRITYLTASGDPISGEHP